MPTFDTPGPLDVRLSLVVADVEFVASDTARTVVEVRPRSGSGKDARAAERTSVTLSGNRLEVTMEQPKLGLLERLSVSGHQGSISLTIEAPAGSAIQGETCVGRLRARGRLGECRFKTSSGDIELDQTTRAHLRTANGLISVDRVEQVEASTAHGRVRIGHVDGRATVENLSGSVEIDEVSGDARITGASGDIVVARALADLAAKTANGNLRVGEVRRGSVSLETAAGNIEVGVREGTAAHVDAHALVGTVQSSLDDADGPGASTSTVRLHARTFCGSIELRRALVDELR